MVTLLTFKQPNAGSILVSNEFFLFFSSLFPSFPFSSLFLSLFFSSGWKRKEKGKEKKENGKEKKEKGKEKKEKGKEKKERLQDWAQIRGSRWLSLPPQLTNWCRSPPVVVWAR